MNLFGTLYGIALLVVLLSLRVSARIRDLAERVSKRRFVQVIVFAPLLLILIDILTLPLSIYGHELQMSYGLVGAGLGIVVLGLDQGRTHRHRHRHAVRLGSVCVPAPQPAALVVLWLARVDSGGVAAGFDPAGVHRAALQPLRTARNEATATVAGAREGDASRRSADRSLAHVRNAGERQGDHVQRLRHRHRREQTRGGMGQHVARPDDSGDAVRVRPRTGTLRAESHLDVARLS